MFKKLSTCIVIFICSNSNAIDARTLTQISSSVAQTIRNTARAHPILACSLACAGGFYAFKKATDFYLAHSIQPSITQVLYTLQDFNDDNFCTLFSHGIADSGNQAYPYKKISISPLITFDYPDSWNGILRVNFTQTSLGQDNEIEKLAQVYHDYCINKNTILLGISRGAATACNFAATNPKNLAALVLESPYDRVGSIIAGKLKQCGLSWIPGSQWAGMAIACSIFGKHKKDGIHPIDQVDTIRADLPILIFCLEGDTTVPLSSSMNLYHALKDSGHMNVHICILPAGGQHTKIINHSEYGPLIEKITHAFYQLYGLPHDKALAIQGQPLLIQYQS